VKVWVTDPEALGPPPPGVELVDRPSPEVEFLVPRWSELHALDELTGLKVIQLLSAGVDGIVDRVPDGVTLCDARGARDRAMGEWIAAAILAEVKHARPFAIAQGRREWQPMTLHDAAGLRILVVGFGSIGRATREMLAPFECEIVGVARTARDGVHGVDELPELLGEFDVVVNLLPLTEQTRGFFGARELGLMRDDALYINAGRGATTDTDALLAELQAQRIRAVLDVVEPEPLPSEHPLWTAPNVMISPHSAGDTPAADAAAWALAAKQLRRYAAGEPLENVVRDGY
jgi:phosphoglycerate dehydrogenase-like enzyme